MRVRTLALFAAFLLPLPMMADTTYTYTGPDFSAIQTTSGSGTSPYTLSDAISGWLTLSAPLPDDLNQGFLSGTAPPTYTTPTAFSFTDGVNTLDVLISNDIFLFITDASGNIVGWDLELVSSSDQDATYLSGLVVSGGSGGSGNLAITSISQSAGQCDTSSSAYSASGCFESVAYSYPGTWTTNADAATPEAPSFLLFLTGAVGLAGVARRKFLRA